jgi:acyl dehydratase
MDDELTLPQWRPAGHAPPPGTTAAEAAESAESAKAAESAKVAESAKAAKAANVAETAKVTQAVKTAKVAEAAEREESGLGTLSLSLTPTFVISTALATRDFTAVHHDQAIARAQGSKDIFLNILTTMGLVQRYVTEKVPGAVLTSMKVRLGVPAYAGDELTLTGRRVDASTVEVRGAVSLGDHVTATVTLGEAQ